MRGRRLSPAVIVLASMLFVLAAVAGYLLGPSRPRTVPATPQPAGLSTPEAPGSSPPPVVVPPAPPASAPSPATPPPGPAGGQTEPAVPPVSQEAPAAAPIPSSPPRFHVQAGAFNIRENAEELVQQLRSRGYTVTLVESGKGPRYRVRVGGELDRAAAERLAATLRTAGFEAALTP